MRKKFVKVALLSCVALGSTASFTSCKDDDWKSPVETVTENIEGVNETLKQLDAQIKDLDNKIAESKSAAEKAATAAADAMKAAQDASKTAEEQAAAAEKAAKAYAEECAQNAIAESAKQLKAEIEAVKALIQQNADAIAANKSLINGNADAIKENAGKIEGNTKAIEDIINQLTQFKGENDSQIKEILDELKAAGVDIENLGKELADQVSGLNAALAVLEGKLEAQGQDVDALKKAVEEQIGSLSETLAAQIASEAALREAGDEALKAMIKDLQDQIDGLALASDLEEYAKFVQQAKTQIAALEAFKTKMESDFSELKGKVDGIDTIVNKNVAAINDLTTKLNETKTLAETNAASIVTLTTNLNKLTKTVGDLTTDFNTYKNKYDELVKEGGRISVLEAFMDSTNGQLDTLTSEVDAINERLNALEPLLNTMILDQLRGLVFIPGAYVGGIESALSYHMNYNALYPVSGTAATYTGLAGYKVSDYNKWNVSPKDGEAAKLFEPATVISYHMNPKSAIVSNFEDLTLVSNDAEILTRGGNNSKAGLALDASYNDGKGFNLDTKEGVLSVAVKGDASVYDPDGKIMPVFALQAQVAGYDDENGKPVINNVTSDYAMFVQMNVDPQNITWNRTAYVKKFGATAMRDFTEVMPNKQIDATLSGTTSAKVAWNGELDLLNLLQINYRDVQRENNEAWTNPEDWGKYGLKMNFKMVDYTIGNEKVSESSWAVIDPETGVLTACVNNDPSKQSPDALGHMPLVYVTVTCGDDLLMDGFIKVKIGPSEDYYTTADITYANIDFSCDEVSVLQPEAVLPLNLITAATGLSESVFLAHYSPVYKSVAGSDGQSVNVFSQFEKSGDEWVELSDAKSVGIVTANFAEANGKTYLDLGWVFLDAADKQKVYQNADHKASTYICFQGNTEDYVDVYVPLTISVNEKATLRMGTKVLARWFRENNNTALLNVPQPTNGKQVTTINTVLDQLWTNDKPTFSWVSGAPKNPAVASHKYYFTAANNRTYEGVKYSVKNATNPNIIGTDKASNANMGDLALNAADGIASEYNNTELYADGTLIATLNPVNGEVTYSTDPAALVYLNKFDSMGGLDRPEAKLEAVVGVVPMSKCDVAFDLENSDFNIAFLRPINVDPTKVFDFTDAQANGDPVSIFGMLSFSDWRNIGFKGNEWLYGYYDVMKIYPVLDEMTSNIADPSKDVFTPVAPSQRNQYVYSHEGNAPVVTYDLSAIKEGNNQFFINKLNAELGTITYSNSEANVKPHKVVIPFIVEYGLGQFKVNVTCNIAKTMGN